ncbi:cell wall anchor [Pilimelia anulata]|uniref:Cell wall anchor n=1 Tax=Pilimelia anulata TaxID=53371 RepID=A0A8J3B7C5_9ACTN|nr:polysaccharide deacetylase family protein [Pilimelia anulata]GGJ79881.1 cell wall anchor [Pilimelia anulata]
MNRTKLTRGAVVVATALSFALTIAAGLAIVTTGTGMLEPTTTTAQGGGKLPAPPTPLKLRPVQQILGSTDTPAVPAAAAKTTAAGTAKGVTAAAAAAATPTAKPRSGAAAPGGGTAKTLVLYDSTGPFAWLGEVYAIQAANLASHFGAWTAAPVTGYKAGDINAYSAVVYVGSTYDEPLPVAFLDDVNATSKSVTWMYDNIWQLAARDPQFAAKRGFTYSQFDLAKVARVDYKGKELTRDARNAAGIMDVNISDAAKTKVLAEAVREDGSRFPWAVRSGNLTYLGEIPFSYVTHDDRYLAYADLLFDTLGAPSAAERKRALVRIEDAGPDSDPAELRAIADTLYAKKIPFSVALYTRYRDPLGKQNNGKAQDYSLLQRPEVIKALKYMEARGGTMIMHGYTHQNGSLINPYDGTSGNDFEFYRAHVDANDSVIYDGPVPGDSAAMVTGRVVSAQLQFALSGLKPATIFEFPHYAGSAVDYQTIHSLFGKRYDRTLYFPGLLSGGTVDHSRATGQYFPYTVRDVYGTVIVPENIGNVEPEAFNNHAARLPSDLIASADRNLVIRDGVASFFYHPYLGTKYLDEVVAGVQGKGYSFVTAQTMLNG